MNRFKSYLLWGVLLATVPGEVLASPEQCAEVHDAVRVVHAESIRQIEQIAHESRSSYRLNVLRAFRRFELRKDAADADEILRLLPKDDRQYEIWMTLGDSLCMGESVDDMATLDDFSSRFSRLLADAVVERPRMIGDYIDFVIAHKQDAGNDFGGDVDKVCQARHREFIDAVAGFSKSRIEWISKHIVSIESCRLP